MQLSIVIPVLNEGTAIAATLQPLQSLREAGHEVIVVDGGSRDGSCQAAEGLIDQLLHSEPGRAIQMNAGAAAARHPLLLFLHADTQLPRGCERLLAFAQMKGHRWGRFDVRLSGRQSLLRLVEWSMNLRSCLTRVATGDQAIFVERALFDEVGGYPAIPLMEDVALSKRLRKFGAPACIRRPVITSSRRWEQGGVVRTILYMWSLRLRYFLGVSPKRLARSYRETR